MNMHVLILLVLFLLPKLTYSSVICPACNCTGELAIGHPLDTPCEVTIHDDDPLQIMKRILNQYLGVSTVLHTKLKEMESIYKQVKSV